MRTIWTSRSCDYLGRTTTCRKCTQYTMSFASIRASVVICVKRAIYQDTTAQAQVRYCEPGSCAPHQAHFTNSCVSACSRIVLYAAGYHIHEISMSSLQEVRSKSMILALAHLDIDSRLVIMGKEHCDGNQTTRNTQYMKIIAVRSVRATLCLFSVEPDATIIHGMETI